ncbi:hypothetical protein L3Q82_009604 [Scortum barcoo]|uniref:Uncharacterized protein n=1 Tax=Scortum barcoo TaxID=214431 RepID=A0ACB8WGJ9_9TELE|nr:hypothetical protein L3Q82_009604 [Scortum barcoo]
MSGVASVCSLGEGIEPPEKMMMKKKKKERKEEEEERGLKAGSAKTKEVIVDYRRSRRTEHAPLLIHGEAVERVNNIKFLGIHITSDLTWSMNTAHLVKKAQQRLFFLRKLKHAGLSPQLLTNFYRATIESILCLSAAVWYGSCTAQD